MRSLVFLLVLGNILIFALSAGWFGDAAGDGAAATPTDSAEAHVPLSPDRIRIVSRGEPPPIPDAPKQCFDWPSLSTPQVAAVEKLAAGNKLLSLVREETQAAKASYWVFIPAPTGGKAASERKVQELKTLGVKKFQLVQEGVTEQWSVSLGDYDSEAAAAEALAALRKIGIRSARHGVKAETPAQFHVRLSGPSNILATARKLADPAVPVDCTADGDTPPGRANGSAVVSSPADAAQAPPLTPAALVAPAQPVVAKTAPRP